MSKQNVLLFCAVRPQFLEVFLFAQLLKQTEIYRPIFVFDSGQNNTAGIINCSIAGIDYVFHTDWRYTINNINNSEPTKKSERVIKKRPILKLLQDIGRELPFEIKENIKKMLSWIYYIYSFIFYFCFVRNNYKLCKRIMVYYKPAFIVVPIETVGYFFDPVFAVAQKNKVPIINIPFCFVKKETTAKWFYDLPPESKQVYRSFSFIHRLFPNWSIQYNNEKLLRSNIGWITACKFYRIEKELPWIDNYGFSSVIAVENQHYYDAFVNEGIPENLLVITGSLQNDIMYRIKKNRSCERQKLLNRYKLLGDKADLLIVISIPEEFDFSNRKGCEFKTHSEIVDALINPFRQYNGINLLFSLHPRLEEKSIKHIEESNAQIAHQPLCELLPCADLFVTVPSAAIRLAITCGTPVVNYDVFQYHDEYYQEAGGVINVNRLNEYEKTIYQLLDNHSILEEFKSKQEMESIKWGNLDGLVSQRYLKLVEELVKNKRG